MTPTRGEQIRQNLDGIAVALQHQAFGGNENIPPTRVIFTPTVKTGGAVGRIMEAKPLTLQPGINNIAGNNVGSEPMPAGNTELWNRVRVRSGSYIQGHLLNHHVHGSGALKENLIPLRGPFNTRMESNFESIVKNRVLGSREILYYRVEAIFGGQGARTHIPEEGDLPTALSFTLKPMTKKAGTTGLQPDDWEKNDSAPNLYTAPNPMDHLLEPDSLPTVAAVLDLTALSAEANTTSLSFSQFENQDVLHQRSVAAQRSSNPTTGGLTSLQHIFSNKEREQAKLDELARITAMTTADSIITFNEFKQGRRFYNDMGDIAHTTVFNQFNSTQRSLRTAAINAALALVRGSGPTAFTGILWIDFKTNNKINFRAESTAESNDVEQVRTEFLSHQN